MRALAAQHLRAARVEAASARSGDQRGEGVGPRARGNSLRGLRHFSRRICRESPAHLLPRVGDHVELGPRRHIHRKDGRRRVADREALALVRNPIQVRHAHAGRRAVHREHAVVLGVGFVQVREQAVARDGVVAHVELELLGRIGEPLLRGARARPRNEGGWGEGAHVRCGRAGARRARRQRRGRSRRARHERGASRGSEASKVRGRGVPHRTSPSGRGRPAAARAWTT